MVLVFAKVILLTDFLDIGILLEYMEYIIGTCCLKRLKVSII